MTVNFLGLASPSKNLVAGSLRTKLWWRPPG